METLFQDARFGLRLLARKPGFTAIAVGTLALGIGANVAVFSLVNAVLLNPLPVDAPEHLVNVYTVDSTVNVPGFTFLPVSYRNYEDLRDGLDVFDGLAFSAPISVTIGEGEARRAVDGYVTSANYFDVVGAAATMGRSFTPELDRPGGGARVVVVSASLWRNDLGADPSIVGRTVLLNNEPFIVAGVAPEGFRGTSTLVEPDQLWVPASAYERVLDGVRRDRFLHRRGLFISVFGRLKDHVSFDEASAAVEAFGVTLASQYPDANQNRGLVAGRTIDAAYGATPYRGADESQVTRYAGATLMMVSAMVLLIACVNLANLLLARGAEREKEMSVRAELGASPARLVQQLLVESVALAALGGIFGVGIAAWGRDLLWSLRPPGIGVDLVDVSIDTTVLLFAFAVTLATGVLFGLAPAAFGASSRDLNARLRVGGRQGGVNTRRARLRQALVAGEVALAFVALVAAGLFVRSLQEGRTVDPGFDPNGLVTVQLNLGGTGYAPREGAVFYDEALRRMRGLPGVGGVALSQRAPVAISPFRAIVPEGESEEDPRFSPAVTVNVVSDGYFETLGMELVEGRAIDGTDREDTRDVAVVSRTFAARYWPQLGSTGVVGRRFRFTQTDRYYEIVGVVGDAVVRDVLEDASPVAYLALRQNYVGAAVMSLRARGTTDPAAIMGSARREMAALDAKLVMANVRTVDAVLAEGLWAPTVGATLLGLFGLIAVVLATVGVYGVLSHTVRQRTQEVGIRLVFGASRAQIYRLLIGQGMVPAIAGLGIGLGLALALARSIAGLLFQVTPWDSTTFVTATLGLLAIALAACGVSVRRAAHLAPTVALRNE